jgi:hypothetical protein
MHGPTGTTPEELAARSLSLCTRMCLPCITGVLKPDQTRRPEWTFNEPYSSSARPISTRESPREPTDDGTLGLGVKPDGDVATVESCESSEGPHSPTAVPAKRKALHLALEFLNPPLGNKELQIEIFSGGKCFSCSIRVGLAFCFGFSVTRSCFSPSLSSSLLASASSYKNIVKQMRYNAEGGGMTTQREEVEMRTKTTKNDRDCTNWCRWPTKNSLKFTEAISI